jgi:hypothetical protein
MAFFRVIRVRHATPKDSKNQGKVRKSPYSLRFFRTEDLSASGPKGRGFKSRRPDQQKSLKFKGISGFSHL